MTLRILLGGIGIAILLASSVEAEEMRQDCRAVDSLARLDYDSSLNLNYIENKEKKACLFQLVGANTTGVRGVSINKAAMLTRDVFKQSIDLKDALDLGAVETLVTALGSADVGSDVFSVELENTLVTLRGRTPILEECLARLAFKQSPYEKLDDVVSCGLSEDRTAYIITASSSSVTLSLRLSLI